jgi:hypothetical protein
MKDAALYLEADEDITSAIDKLQKNPATTVQIVVPKRSSMLQSIINLKLLKKAADNSGKQVVLVTGDRIAGDLAARVGLAVAASVGGKAVVGEAKPAPRASVEDEVIEESDPEPPAEGAEAAEATPATPSPKPKRLLLRRREVSDESSNAASAAKAAVPAMSSPKAEPDASDAEPASAGAARGPRVPNFGRMQRRALWLVAGVVLVGGYFLGTYFFASAKVSLYASATKSSIDANFTVDPSNDAKTDASKGILAGQAITVSKDLSGPFTPTGQKDAGSKASGTMTMYNEYDMNPHTLVAGTRLRAPDGKVFTTRTDTTVPGATVGLVGGKITLNPGKSDPVSVEAAQNGDSYNEAPARYTVVAYTGDMQTKIYGQGSQMSGGTTRTVTVVTQPDVDSAAAGLIEKDKDNVKRALEGKLPDGYVLLESSQSTKTSSVSPAPAVDAEATNATVSLKATYAALAVKKSEYTSFLQAQETKQIGDENQIYDDGIANAQITAAQAESGGRQTFHFTTEAYSGKKIDKQALAKSMAGKRYGDAVELASRQPSVSRVEISLNPSWSASLPKRSSNITVTIKVADSQ